MESEGWGGRGFVMEAEGWGGGGGGVVGWKFGVICVRVNMLLQQLMVNLKKTATLLKYPPKPCVLVRLDPDPGKLKIAIQLENERF